MKYFAFENKNKFPNPSFSGNKLYNSLQYLDQKDFIMESEAKQTWETPEVIDFNVDDTTTPKNGYGADATFHTS